MSAADRDLTRWNRAGLKRFRYVDGNAASYLEELRLALLSRFLEGGNDEPGRSVDWWREVWAHPPDAAVDPDAREELDATLEELRGRLLWTGEGSDPGPLWVSIPPRLEAEGERAERLRMQYEGARRDLAWEIARSFTRAAHVLTEHLDAYANEGFLGTATQWESVRRLAAMLDTRPAPPASASTVLLLRAKDGRRGKVEKGFQVKHAPLDGGAPVLFETLEDLEIDAALNELRPAGFDRNPAPVQGSRLTLDGRVKGLRTGEPLILEDERNGNLHAYVIRGVLEGDAATLVDVAPPVEAPLVLGRTVVHAVPRERLAPLGPASTSVQVGRALYLTEEPSGLLQGGDVVWVGDGHKSLFRRVDGVQGRRLSVDADLGELRIERTEAGLPVQVPVTSVMSRTVEHTSGGNVDVLVVKVAGDWTRLLGGQVADRRSGGTLAALRVFGVDYRPVGSGMDDAGYSFLRLEWQHSDTSALNPQAIYAPPPGGGIWKADRFLVEQSSKVPPAIVTTVPKKTAAGDLAAVVNAGRVAWARLGSVEVDTALEQATLRAEADWRDRGGGPYFFTSTTVHSHFERRARLAGWDSNSQALTGTEIPLDEVSPALRSGRIVFAGRDDQPGTGTVAKIVEVKSSSIVLDAALPAGATHGNLVLSGNAAAAGHGEAKEEKVLGSGDASQSGQVFVFPEKGISFVSDPAQPSGVRADIEVRVGDRIWQQVPTLANSGPADPHFVVRMTEDGGLELTFGDGRNGRRLPTGTNNVRIGYRVGTGLAGNLTPGLLEKPARPHPLVESVRQPLPATGGNDMEGIESLRTTAPASISTLGRAVSLTDFGRLATSQSSVWQARAFSLAAGLGKQESVRVVVVPAGGGPLGSLKDSLRVFLEANALPGVSVRVDRYQSVPVSLDVTLQVRTAEFDPDHVVALVRERLLAAFGLRGRRMGQAIRIGEVYRIVEAVSGVSSSRVILNGDASRNQVAAPPDGVVHLDSEQSSLTVTYKEFEL